MILILKVRKLSPREAKELMQVCRAGAETEPKAEGSNRGVQPGASHFP